MTPPPPLTADLLLAHSSALRALARSLLRDAHAAEDALQETFARALERPPVSLERLGAWLRAVLESVAHKRLRGEGRRARRERDAARGERVPAIDESLGRGEVLRTVLEAVLALDEPYREVVLDRYFEGLAPREIARRRGLSIHTVTSRLGRARGRLRQRLEGALGGRERDWRRGLSAAFGLAQFSAPSVPAACGLIPGVIAVSLKTKIVAAAALALLVSVGWFARSSERAPGAEAETKAEGALAPQPVRPDAAAPDAVALASEDEQREAATALVSDARAERTLPPYRFPLLVVVRDAEDRPLAGAPVDVAPREGVWNRAGVTDSHGRLELVLRGRAPTLPLALRVTTNFGSDSATRALVLAAGERTGVAFGLENGSFVFEMTFGDSSDGGTFQLQPVVGFLGTASPAATVELARYHDGSAAFVEPPLGAPPEVVAEPTVFGEPVRASVLELDGSSLFEVFGGELEVQGIRGRMLSSVSLSLPTEGAGPEEEVAETLAARAIGRLANADGSALAGVRVEARDASGAVVGETHTDEEGAYELQLQVADEVALFAGGGERGVATTSWKPSVEPELRWNPTLDRGHELLGRLVDEAGAPLAGWTVAVGVDDADEPHFDAGTTGEDGRFAIPNLPRRPLRLAFRAAGAQNELALVQMDEVWPTFEERKFELGPEARRTGGLRVSVTDGAGAPLEGCELAVWQAGTGFSAPLGAGELAGEYGASGIPAGDYELEIAHPHHGVVAGASFRLGPGEELDLGLVRVELPGALVLAVPANDAIDEPLALELWRLHAGHEARVIEAATAPAEALRLAPGRYELVAARGATRVVRELAIEPGARTEIALDELALPAGAKVDAQER